MGSIEWFLVQNGCTFLAVLFYLIAGWQRLCVMALMDPELSSSMARGLEQTPWRAHALNLLFVLL